MKNEELLFFVNENAKCSRPFRQQFKDFLHSENYSYHNIQESNSVVFMKRNWMFTSQYKHEYVEHSDSQWSVDKKLRCPSASRWKNPDNGTSVSIKSKWAIKLYKENTWKKLKWKSLRKICKSERETRYTILWKRQNYRRIVRSESRRGEE